MKTANQIGEVLGVTGRYVRILAERRQIPFFEVGPRTYRFDENAVLATLKRDRREPTGSGSQRPAKGVW